MPIRKFCFNIRTFCNVCSTLLFFQDITCTKSDVTYSITYKVLHEMLPSRHSVSFFPTSSNQILNTACKNYLQLPTTRPK
ncbi:unnamed protein product [Nesidiocoris tenuis]|uniref:Uncharacterized protein n=1 Tax=Nesidiocoris tenuis TaxID=355587 RepID=A0A6H5HED8_9HEMI|nr:unnamed protein product [Nesidiocoris tenuis]